MWQSRAISALLLIIAGISLGCNHRNAPPTKPAEETTATINLSAVTNSSQTEVFHKVERASRLPSAVLDKLGGIADPGQPYNTTDGVDSKLPMRQLVVAAVSENYCIVTYWHGGIALRLETTIFELSAGRVKRMWDSAGGSLNFQDLKETKIQEATAKGIQPNKFLLPPAGPFKEPYFADLRKITPITVPYFQGAKKPGSLSEKAVVALQAHLGLFFSRYVIYVQPISCPHCGKPVDPKAFIAAFTDEADVD